MNDSVIDRGGSIGGSDAMPIEGGQTGKDRSKVWTTIAAVGAFAGLVGVGGGVVIGYMGGHTSKSASTAQPAKASERSVDDVLVDPAAQRAALANKLGTPAPAQLDANGKPIPGANVLADGQQQGPINAYGTTAPAPNAPNGQPGQPAQPNPAKVMADAARRAPIMAFASNQLGSNLQRPAGPLGLADGAAASNPSAPLAPVDNGAPAAAPRAPNDFSDQLNHAQIQTVRATMVESRSFLLSAGTLIPCSLQTAINSTQAGFVSCVINHDVFSEDGRIVLLDKGTKVLGQYAGGLQQGQARLFIVWTRALTPRGVVIDLGSPAADELGRAGVGGGVDTQFWQRFGGALMLSVLEDLGQAASSRFGQAGTNTTQVPANTASTALEGTNSIKPILKKNQGDYASIFVAKDFDFRSVYEIHLRR